MDWSTKGFMVEVFGGRSESILKETERELWIVENAQSFLPIGVQLGSRQGVACDQRYGSRYPMSLSSLSKIHAFVQDLRLHIGQSIPESIVVELMMIQKLMVCGDVSRQQLWWRS